MNMRDIALAIALLTIGILSTIVIQQGKAIKEIKQEIKHIGCGK